MYCVRCQFDLRTALLHADELEAHCSRRQCPFANNFRELKMNRTGQIFSAQVSPDRVLEGSDVNIRWSYRGDPRELESISLNVFKAHVIPNGQTTIKADKRCNKVEFTLKMRGLQPIKKIYTYQVLPLPVVRLTSRSRIARNSRVIVSADLSNVATAYITDASGKSHDFTSGEFMIPCLSNDFKSTIEVTGRYGGNRKIPVSISVFDPPKIEICKPIKEKMIVGKAGLKIQVPHAVKATVSLRSSENKFHFFDLNHSDLKKDIHRLNIKAGKWWGHIEAYNKEGDVARSYIEFRLLDPLTVRTGRVLFNALAVAFIIAGLGSLIYAIWPLLVLLGVPLLVFVCIRW